MIWAEAEGCRVVDSEGREYIDLTGGFGVAALGHRNPRILDAWSRQRVVHALGDLADAEVTAELRLALPWPAKLGVTGEDSVEIALRTALLATGRPGIVCFDGAYHGTGLLAVATSGFEAFREPFAAWLPGPVYRRGYGEDPGSLPASAGCVIVEPVQGRAGARVPPADFLARLRERCDESGALLVVGAIYCGLGRIGELWPGAELADVLCVGKALGGGLPLSAALFVRGELESVCVWGLGPVDVYTHTHVGNPLACAGALVVLDEVPRLLERGGRRAVRAWRLARSRPSARPHGRCRRGAQARRPRHPGRPRRVAHLGDPAADDLRRGDRRGARASAVTWHPCPAETCLGDRPLDMSGAAFARTRAGF